MNDNKVYIKMNKPFDEIYTKRIDADQLVKYLKDNNVIDNNSLIWLPFNDWQATNISKALLDGGYSNQKLTKDDFYNLNESCDIIISNPPFSKRTKLFTRLMELDKPFILLQPIQAFNNNSFVKMLCKKSNDFGFLCPKNRMGLLLME